MAPIKHGGTHSIPHRGFGTFQTDFKASSASTVKQAVLTALATGYRHIDTALSYSDGQIEKQVGLAIAESGIARKDIFVVTKLPNTHHRREDVELALRTSLQNLGLDHVDLYLMHNAYAYASDDEHKTIRRADGSGKPVIDVPLSRNYSETFKAMQDLVDLGLTKAIGLSNFNILKMTRLMHESGIKPAALQVEIHPYFPQPDVVEFCQRHGIQVIAHCPLGGAVAEQVAGRRGTGPLQDNLINYIAAVHSKTPAQVILAWLVQRNVCVVPKSSNIDRIRENFEELRLSPAEHDLISNITLMSQPAQRNLVSATHIGFDTFDEDTDQP